MTKAINKSSKNQNCYVDHVHDKDVDLEKKLEMVDTIKRNVAEITKER